MNKKVMKVLSVLLIVMAVVSFSTSVFADFTPSNVNEYVDTDNASTNQVKNFGGDIISIISIIGMIASVAILMILGVKYMMGSAEEKAEYKKTLLPYIIGAVLLFAASGIAQFLFTTFKGWGETTSAIINYIPHM